MADTQLELHHHEKGELIAGAGKAADEVGSERCRPPDKRVPAFSSAQQRTTDSL